MNYLKHYYLFIKIGKKLDMCPNDLDFAQMFAGYEIDDHYCNLSMSFEAPEYMYTSAQVQILTNN